MGHCICFNKKIEIKCTNDTFVMLHHRLWCWNQVTPTASSMIPLHSLSQDYGSKVQCDLVLASISHDANSIVNGTIVFV